MLLSAYFDQFNVMSLIGLEWFNGEMVMIFTNSSVMVGLVSVLIWMFFKGGRLVPSRWRLIMELVSSMMWAVVIENLGWRGQQYYPLILSFFWFILVLNVLGLLPYVFTPTAHIVLTLGMSFSVVLGVTMLGLRKHKVLFLSLLVPGGVPLSLAPFLSVIETLSYGIRALSLGVRLAANISAGHLLFAILSGFAFNLWFNGAFLVGWIPLLVMGFITLLEMMVAVIQAYVFSLLVTIYIRDGIELH